MGYKNIMWTNESASEKVRVDVKGSFHMKIKTCKLSIASEQGEDIPLC